MAGIKKKEISLSSIKDKFSTKTKYKETEFYNCGQAFYDACGLPGPVLGGISMMLGHSNAGKTTAMILAAVGCPKERTSTGFHHHGKESGVGSTRLSWG
jgi:hypothetical protein